MKRLAIIAGAVCFLAACNNSSDTEVTESTVDTTKKEAPVTSEWRSLFDGKTLAGWHKYGGGEAAGWKVADSAMYVDTKVKEGRGDLVTDEEFENFHLKLEWKISKAGNSGIMFYVIEDTAKFKNTYESGPEMQVIDNVGHADGKFIKHHAGDLYDLISSSKDVAKPFGEWNQVEIRSLNGKLDFYLNGENIVSTTMWDDNWNKMIADSKFKAWPGFGTFKKGRIALQDHGDAVWYRNIQVMKL
jgi:hypothetical protein